MCCILTTGIKFVVSAINMVLMIAFVTLAVCGILLNSSATFVEQLVKGIAEFTDDEALPITIFIKDNAGTIAIVLIIVGFGVAAFCLIGFVASCCGCSLLLKIYAGILGALILAESIGTGVVFGVPNLIKDLVEKALLSTTGEYGKRNNMATALWDLITTKDGHCCGLDGYGDFRNESNAILPSLPMACCTIPSTVCTEEAASQFIAPGCRPKIEAYLDSEKITLLAIPLVLIGVQAVLFGLTVFAICIGKVAPI